jgi:hypothetical protein
LKSSDGSGEAKRFIEREHSLIPLVYSSDGDNLLFLELNPDSGKDIWLFPGNGEAVPLINSPFDDEMPSLSSDGQWIAYVSNESGQQEVYVQSFPQLGNKIQISTDGGREPVWRKNSHELFYRWGDKIMSVSIRDNPDFVASNPQVVLEGPYTHGFFANWDVSPGGERFVFLKRKDQDRAKINIILNWFEELKKMVPRDK